MAEGVGFEPTVPFPGLQFSRLPPSSTRPPIQVVSQIRLRTVLLSVYTDDSPVATPDKPPGEAGCTLDKSGRVSATPSDPRLEDDAHAQVYQTVEPEQAGAELAQGDAGWRMAPVCRSRKASGRSRENTRSLVTSATAGDKCGLGRQQTLGRREPHVR